MLQQVKVLASRPDDLSSIPETHVVEGENFLQVVLRLINVSCYGMNLVNWYNKNLQKDKYLLEK